MIRRRGRFRLAALLALSMLLAACSTVAPPAAPPTLTRTPSAPEAAPVSAATQPDGPEAGGGPGAAPMDTVNSRMLQAFDDPATRADLWQRVREGYAMPDLEGELVAKWEQWYASRPDYVQRMTERGGRYLFHILEEVQRRGMPNDLALLPFIESAFNPQALSGARASGIWQFMPATGKDFDLRQNLFRDDRRDVLASTNAALDYLQQLYAQFNDWHLALAAYNWGQGNVRRALERNRRAGLGTDYASLRMPDETRNYVPKLQAVKNIVGQPQRFGLVLPPLENHPFFISVPVERDIDVALAARLAGLSVDDFQQLNPQHNKPVILAAGTPQILLPYDNANLFVRQLAQHRGPRASWTAWVAPRTLKPAEAARKIGVPEATLREVNRIPPRMLVKSGSTLLVPRGERVAADVPSHLADHAQLLLAPEAPALRRVAFKAGKKGDSVAAVAKRYRVSAAQVAQWNGVAAQALFKPGQSIVVMVPHRPGTRKAAKRSAKPAAAQRTSVAKN